MNVVEEGDPSNGHLPFVWQRAVSRSSVSLFDLVLEKIQAIKLTFLAMNDNYQRDLCDPPDIS